MSRSDAAPKLRGAVGYGPDLFDEGMLYAALVPAPVAHGTIRHLDLRAARKAPGVAAVVGPEELADLLPNGGRTERPVFPLTEILYRNQPVAAVAAETLAQARAAAALVTIDVAPLPIVADAEEVFPDWPGPEGKEDPRVVAHVLAERGDLEAAFRAAEFVQRETFRTAGVHQAALEPHACLATYAHGQFHVRTTTQTPFGTREDTAEILGIPQTEIVVEGTWVGGGFGGKGASMLEPYALVLALATGRPVKLVLSYREEFLLGRSTLPAVFRLETAVRDGKMTARRVRMLLDSGASLPGRDFATGYAIGFLLGPYRIPTFQLEGYAVRTNKPPFGPHRAPVAPQCAFAAESHTDGIARRLGVDPIEFRLTHAWTEGDTTGMGQPVGPFGLRTALEEARRVRDDWARSRPDGAGTGIAVGFWSTSTGAGGEARLRLAPDGLTIHVGEQEIGSGSVVGGLVAVATRTLGLPPEAIHVEYHDTEGAPYDTGVFGSRTVGALGYAVEKAAKAILTELGKRLTPGTTDVALLWQGGRIVVRAAGGSRPLDDLLAPTERSGGGVAAEGKHYGGGGRIDESLVRDGQFYPYTDFTASVTLAEVRVDPETGAVTPTRVAGFLDVGRAMDAALVREQVQGAVAMGLGTALTEESMWGAEGKLANPSFLDYRIPTLGEIPAVDVHLIEGFPGAGPSGAKGVGEPPMIPVAAAVANAVAAATGARVVELPMTPERVARALKAR